MRDSYLYPTLQTGASRVFNVCKRTLDLQRADDGEETASDIDYFFKVPELNKSIILKEARTNKKTVMYNFQNPIGTKIYFPFDCDKIYDGGKSLFSDDPQLMPMLRDHAGLDPERREEDTARDLALLSILQDIPALDPFLIKDKVQIEGLKVNEAYLDITHENWVRICKHVSGKLSPIIKFVFEDADGLNDRRAANLLSKLWNTKDIDALMPIVKTFRLPVEEASQIFASWKGVMYFEYVYERSLPGWKEYAKWLKHDVQCVDHIDRNQKALLKSVYGLVSEEIGTNWIELRKIFEKYDNAYDLLFIKRETPGPFIEFMKDAVETYWFLGTKLSVISHCVSVWKILTPKEGTENFTYDKLYNLLETQNRILQCA